MFLILAKIAFKILAKMFGATTESKLSGPGYIVLNIIRVLNIISLLMVVVASWVMLVMTVKTSNFFFFDGVSHFITSSIGIFLIVSELPIAYFKNYFLDNWPVLSAESGFVGLGLAMMALGFNILGNLNKQATSVENLGLPFWRVVISSGILTAIMGVFNLIATFIFSNRKKGITGRQVRSHGAIVPDPEMGDKSHSFTSGSLRPPPSPGSYATSPEDRRKSHFGLKFPIRLSHISRPIPKDKEQFEKFNSRSSPVMPDVQRPPTALHPIHQGTPAPYPPSSRYSVASIDRF